MKIIYTLKTCSTCKRIIDELNLPEAFEIRDIKSNPMTEKEVDHMAKMAGSYEALFSRRAQLYKQRELKDQNLSEQDIKSLILEHYTFLSRPVIIDGDHIFIGNSGKTVAAAKARIHEND